MTENKDVPDGNQALTRASGLVLVMDTPKGRGVFATQDIPSGTIVDVSPVLIFTEDEVENHTRHTVLQHYTYYWPSASGRGTTQAIALGLGSMFNHSTLQQNIGWKRNTETAVIVYSALRNIKTGEELCISYGSARLWFPDADADADAIAKTDAADDRDSADARLKGLTELEMSGLGCMEL